MKLIKTITILLSFIVFACTNPSVSKSMPEEQMDTDTAKRIFLRNELATSGRKGKVKTLIHSSFSNIKKSQDGWEIIGEPDRNPIVVTYYENGLRKNVFINNGKPQDTLQFEYNVSDTAVRIRSSDGSDFFSEREKTIVRTGPNSFEEVTQPNFYGKKNVDEYTVDSKGRIIESKLLFYLEDDLYSGWKTKTIYQDEDNIMTIKEDLKNNTVDTSYSRVLTRDDIGNPTKTLHTGDGEPSIATAIYVYY